MHTYEIHNYLFPGRKDESCSKDDHCKYPMMCINKMCNCPITMNYVRTTIHYTIPAFRCVPKSGKFSYAILSME